MLKSEYDRKRDCQIGLLLSYDYKKCEDGRQLYELTLSELKAKVKEIEGAGK
ncbi:Fur-regulated basic protein FbpA (plasmid) [Bacillus carboniphilus]|uniref:Fur-regulated basic protein FbpA n=1 Tax=Bacillus carboniphilus TaxID=86663 RepID=A0ABY9JYI2_9BACI|nr:Fur-regulated basic protein FbpA [Bacillus carboniphilus]WLR44410.1 Fur-regulated basic protein FbpA [Bacillus carboniphilus]